MSENTGLAGSKKLSGTQVNGSAKPALLLVVILVLAATSGPGTAALHASEYRVEHYTTADGLSQSHVYALEEDSTGVIWMATRDGLNMFDGIEFSVFRHQPGVEGTIKNNSIDCLAIDSNGSVWCSVGNLGVDTYDRSTGKWKHYPMWDEKAQKNQLTKILDIEFDVDGCLWVASERGVFQLDEEQKRLRRFQGELDGATWNDDFMVGDLHLGQEGSLWMTINHKGFGRLDTRRKTFDYFKKIYLQPEIVGERGNEHLFKAEYPITNLNTQPVYDVFDYLKCKTYPQWLNLENPPLALQGAGRFQVLGVEPDGVIWLAGLDPIGQEDFAPGGLYRLASLHGPVETIFEGGWSDNQKVMSFTYGTAGIVWLGTTDGVLKIVPRMKRFETLSYTRDGNGLSHNVIRDIKVDSRGDIWVGTDYGLNHIAAGTDTVRQVEVRDYGYGNLSDRRRNVVNEIFEDEDGTIFLGMNRLLRALDSSRSVIDWPPNAENSLNPKFGSGVWSLERDHLGRLWVGTRHLGIFVLNRDNECVKHIIEDSLDAAPFRGGIVWELMKDSSGQIWAATASGIYQFDPETFSCRTFGTSDSTINLTSNNTISVNQDSQGKIWITSYGFGIAWFDSERGEFEVLDSRTGLNVDLLYGILEDANGAYWGSSNSGLLRFDPVARTSRFFTERDGLPSNEFVYKAYARAQDGRLLFGGLNGLTMFYPDSLLYNPHLPPISITAFSVMDGPERLLPLPEETLVVDHSQKLLRFRFAALDHINPELNQYAYMLEGFDEDWVYCGTRREVVFTNLDPGEYVLRVRGSNNDGRWNEAGTSVRLIVVPPFWMTWWFWMAVVAAVGTLAAWIITGRVRLLLARKTLRQRVLEYRLQTLRLQMNPHFIFNLLSSIESLIIKRREREAVESLASFARLVRGVLDSSRSNTVPVSEELSLLRVYLDLEHLRHNGGFDYDVEVDSSIHQRQDHIPSMLIQPYVENAIKHGLIHTVPDGCVSISLQRVEDRIHCVIEDNGIGRAAAQAHQRQNGRSAPAVFSKSSIGMSVSRERLNLLNSTLSESVTCQVQDLKDPLGKATGTRISLYIPIDLKKNANQDLEV